MKTTTKGNPMTTKKTATKAHSRTADKFVVRLPEGMRDQIADRAEQDDRSMNAVFVQALKKYLNEAEA